MPRQDKRAKSAFNPKNSKQAKHQREPGTDKRAKQGVVVPDGNGPFILKYGSVDTKGPFAWDWVGMAEQHLLQEVLEKLRDLATKNLTELRQQGSHHLDVEGLNYVVQGRLYELGELVEKVFSFRIEGRPRVICIHEVNVMRVLWWDPEHRVWPTEKKNT